MPTGAYFAYHRDSAGKALRISEPMQSRLTGRPTILLSKRISKEDGSFGGVLTAAIDSDYFSGFYRAFQLGPDGGISLLRNDGAVLSRWPFSNQSTDLSKIGPVHDTPQAELGRILQDHLAVRRRREIFRLRGNAAISAGRHGGDVRRLAALGLVDGAAHRRARGGRAALHDHPARRIALGAVQFPHQDRTRAAARASRIIACWRTISPTSSSCSTAAARSAMCRNRSNRCWAFARRTSSANPASTWFTPRTRKA